MLENLFTGVLGVLLAGAGDGRPNLFVALALPPVLAVLLVLGTALSLSVGIVLGPVLIHADLVIYRVTLALLNGGALLPRHVDAILLDEVLALLLVDRLAYLRFGWWRTPSYRRQGRGHVPEVAQLRHRQRLLQL